jgi:hypothetical protein
LGRSEYSRGTQPMGSPVQSVGVPTGHSLDSRRGPVGRHKGKFKDRFLGRIVVPIRLGWPTFSSHLAH